ncbi:MAG TPA: type II toxin-antitoxin system prevent-host-death family antitoxin [Clostridiaceae bacterium]|jgi:prevent-host-death family protein|nr:type II toxin-antitoxin system prevent-host-death family antitoxin [Clostridiaceae bacterium]
MIVTTTELQNNFGKYINIMQNEPVIFTKNGKIIGKLVAIKEDKKVAFEKLEKLKYGLQNVDEEEKIYGRMEKYNV